MLGETVDAVGGSFQGASVHEHLDRVFAHPQPGRLSGGDETVLRQGGVPQGVTTQRLQTHGSSVPESLHYCH